MLAGYRDVLDAAGRHRNWWTHQLLATALSGDLPAMLRDDGLAGLFGHRFLVMLPLSVHGLPSDLASCSPCGHAACSQPMVADLTGER